MIKKIMCLIGVGTVCVLVQAADAERAGDQNDQLVVVKESTPVVLKSLDHGIKGFEKLTDSTKDALREAGWLARPSAATVLKAGAWVACPIAAMVYLNHLLKKDKKARLLKLKKNQPQDTANPMAQLLMMMQMQGMGGGLTGTADEAVPQEKPELVDITWNENDILSGGRRRLLEGLLFMARACAVLGIVNFVDVLKDCWKGNTVPSAVRKYINTHIELENKKVEINEEYQKLDDRYKADFEIKLAKKMGVSLANCGEGLKSIFDKAKTQAEQSAIKGKEIAQESAFTGVGNVLGLPIIRWFAYLGKNLGQQEESQ